MKNALTRLFMVLLFIFAVITPSSAGVEPSPFKEVVNKINSVGNNLESINKRLEHIIFEHVISKSISEDSLSKSPGTENKLESMADKLCGCKDKLDKALDRLPDEEKRYQEITVALEDIGLKAGSIVHCINKLYLNPDYIDIAPERVKANAQIIGYAVNKYSTTNGCSRSGDTETRVLSSSTVIGGTEVEVDEDGFICNFDDWNEEVTVEFAKTEEIDEGDWTEEHWEVVYYLRRYYQKFGVAPMIRKLCEETEFPLKKIYALFPTGPAKGACKVAGLPKPTGCV